MVVLVLNCGSSSIKYQLLNMANVDSPEVQAIGVVERIGLDGSNYELHLKSNELKIPVSRSMVKPLKSLLQ